MTKRAVGEQALDCGCLFTCDEDEHGLMSNVVVVQLCEDHLGRIISSVIVHKPEVPDGSA